MLFSHMFSNNKTYVIKCMYQTLLKCYINNSNMASVCERIDNFLYLK